MASPPSGSARDRLIASVLEFFVGEDLLTREEVRVALEREIDESGSEALLSLRERLTVDNGWGYHPRDPLAQRIHHALADRLLRRDSALEGIERLTGLPEGPLTLLANHLSYADANVVEILLQRAGAGSLANRLTTIAGPKVFTSSNRRFSSLCFGTVKAPQSSAVSSGEAVLASRDVARAARSSIEAARGRLAAGDALLVFGEGTRTRTGGLQAMLPGVARYLDLPGTWIVPVGLAGTEALFPLDGDTVHPARVVMRVGQPLEAGRLLAHAGGDRRILMDAVGLAVAETLPPAYQGVYQDQGRYPDARRALDATRRPA